MAAMTLEPRDPDMSHFIDQYKFERQMAERRDKFGGGTVSSRGLGVNILCFNGQNILFLVIFPWSLLV